MGANPNHKDKVLQTPLFYAAREGKLEVCKLLVEKGVDVDHMDNRKQIALHFAKKFKRDDVVDYLT